MLESVPLDIVSEVALKLKPSELFNMCQVNKKYSTICRRDSFWRKYYSIHVNPRYELNDHTVKEREGKREGKREDSPWKRRFMENYSEIITLDLKDIKKKDIWCFDVSKLVPTGDDQFRITHINSFNYIVINNRDGILTCAYILLPESFDKTLKGQFLYISQNKKKGAIVSLSSGKEEDRWNGNAFKLLDIKDITIVKFPYRRIEINVNKYEKNYPRKYDPNVPGETISLSHRSIKFSLGNSDPNISKDLLEATGARLV